MLQLVAPDLELASLCPLACVNAHLLEFLVAVEHRGAHPGSAAETFH